MKRGVLIIGRDEEIGTYIREMNDYEKHAIIIQEYCDIYGIQNVDGFILGIALAKHGELVFQIDDFDIIIYIPILVTNYQLANFDNNVKSYLSNYIKRYGNFTHNAV